MQVGSVDGIELLIGEEGDFGFDRTGQQRNFGRELRAGNVRPGRKRAAIEDGLEAQGITRSDKGVNQLFGGKVLELSVVGRFEVKLGEKKLRGFRGVFAGDAGESGATFCDGAVK